MSNLVAAGFHCTFYFKISLICRLDGALSAGKTSSRAIVNGGLLKVRPAALPHDVVLVSEEGTEMECHKCVLVTRSGTH